MDEKNKKPDPLLCPFDLIQLRVNPKKHDGLPFCRKCGHVRRDNGVKSNHA